MGQIDLVQDRNNWGSPAKIVINYCVSNYAGKFFDYLITVIFSRRTLLHGVRK